MKKPINTEDFSEHLFWDIDRNKFSLDKNKQLVIERVFTRGDIDDLKKLIRLYGIVVIKEEIVKVGFLDKKTLNWASLFLCIPKTEFKCFTKIQSEKVHWNF